MVRLFDGFERHQNVTKCWRKTDGEWAIKEIPFVEQWREADYLKLIDCLNHTLGTGGVVFGAFYQDALKGFSSVEGKLFGMKSEYLDLSCIHVSEDMRGQKVGKMLFGLAKKWAKAHGAEKLYISAHSAVETQAFYRAMGCVEAAEYNPEHVEEEPCDCQLECVL